MEQTQWNTESSPVFNAEISERGQSPPTEDLQQNNDARPFQYTMMQHQPTQMEDYFRPERAPSPDLPRVNLLKQFRDEFSPSPEKKEETKEEMITNTQGFDKPEESEPNSWRLKFDDAIREIEHLQKTLRINEVELAACTIKKTNLEKNVEMAERENAEMKQRVNAVVLEKMALETNIEILKDKIKQLRNSIVTKNKLVEQLKAQIQQLTTRSEESKERTEEAVKEPLSDLDTSFMNFDDNSGRSKEFSTAATSTVKVAVMVLTFVVGWIAIALFAGERSVIDTTKVEMPFHINTLPVQARLDVHTFNKALDYFSEHELELVLKHEKIDSVIRPLQQQIVALASKLESTENQLKQWQHDYNELDKQHTSLVLRSKETEARTAEVQQQFAVLENEIALLKTKQASDLNRNDTYCICNPGHSECSPMKALRSVWTPF